MAAVLSATTSHSSFPKPNTEPSLEASPSSLQSIRLFSRFIQSPPATSAQIAEINRQEHKEEDQAVFRTYHDIDKALRNQLIDAVDTIPLLYILALSDATIGFGDVSCLTLLLLAHLWTQPLWYRHQPVCNDKQLNITTGI